LSVTDAPPDGIKAKSHMDGICLNSSVWLDGVQVLEQGVLVQPELKKLGDVLLKM
jgi:leucyl aminopeptidase (aminopeptidase T)